MAAIALSLLSAAPAIITGVASAVHAIESLFGHGHGAAKKQAVITAVQSAAQVYDDVAKVAAPTFPQLNDATVTEALGQLIDAVVGFYNSIGAFTHSSGSGTAK